MSQDKQSTSERRNLTVRLSPAEWRRVRELALDLEITVQDMLVAGLNRIFVEQQREPLNPNLHLLPPDNQTEGPELDYEPKVSKVENRTDRKDASMH